MRRRLFGYARGFTLLEIIITLTITAVLATMIFTYFGKAFTESVTPITRLKSSAVLQRVMENITADYNVYPKWRSGAAYTNASYVIPTNFNGYYYQCTIAGTSGPSEPTNWPLRSGVTITDNTVTWTWSGRLRTFRPLATLQTSIGAEGSDQDNAYGKYHVVKNRFTQFLNDVDQDSDASGANIILKVTLRNDSGETQTALFVSD
ncbi:MAG: prepilin-type N-terminal cleavage/methylation domain-containing protein [Pseudomonadota bacterium]